MLSLERVALRNDRSIATIEDGKIKLIKRHGKWDVFETNGSYLEPHVALLLIELVCKQNHSLINSINVRMRISLQNRLEVYLGKMVVSLECAYHMFLTHEITSEYSNNTEKLTKCEYLVYSHFKRFGCNIRRFKNDSTSLSSQGNAKDVDESSQLDKTHLKDYIWNHLYELLGHRKSVISGKVNDNRSSDIKLAMNTTIQKFKHNACIQTDPRSDITETCKKNIGHKKRQCSNASDSDVPVTKSVKLAHTSDYQYFGSGSTNDFMVGNVFLQFKNIFSKVDYIDVRKPYSYDNQKKINERFSFDLWDSLDKQCQSTGADYRLIIKYVQYNMPIAESVLINEFHFLGLHPNYFPTMMTFSNSMIV